MRTPPNERERLRKLKTLRVPEDGASDFFDQIAQLAAQVCGCPIALVSFMDETTQWISSQIGFTDGSIPRECSPCSETLLGNGAFVIEDLLGEPRFAHTALVTGEAGIRFYAGAALITKDNCAIGTVCVMHTAPHSLSPAQVSALETLAHQAARHVEMRQELSLFQTKVNALGESERRFRTIADASAMLLWISDDAGNRTFFNHAWCDFTGLSREDGIADHWLTTIHPDDREIYHRKWREASQQKLRFQQEFRLRHCSGTYRWVLEQAMPMFSSSGRLEGYMASCVDLSSRITDELQYQNNEARFRAISEAAPLGIFVTDSDGNYIYTNQQFQKITGQSAEQSLGSGWLKAIADEDRERISASWYTATKTAQPFEEIYRYSKEDGEIAWASVKAAAINATDTVSGWVGTVEDITARRRADADLIAAKHSAEAAMLAKGQFLANMSHEIRTPLTAMIGFAEALRNERDCAPDTAHCLDVILSNGQHLLEIINGILDLSKIDAGALTIERSRFSIVELVESIRLMFLPRLAEKAIAFSVNYQWPLPAQVSTDPLRLKQVLINLLSNAIKFTDKGGIALSLWFDPLASKLSFSVTDTGVGIAADEISRLFQPFSQANETITRRYGGTGLGLSISSHLVHALGGELSVISEPGRGSTFSFFITPFIEAESQFIKEIPNEESAPKQPVSEHLSLRGRVLFADDALDNRRLVDHLLKKAGIEPVLVEDGQQAIERAIQEEFDLILLDVQMPNVDGLSAARALRKAGLNTPIVSLSAGAMTSDVMKAIEAGCSMHLAKPFSRESFFGMLRQFLNDESSTPEQSVALSSKLSEDCEMNQLIVEFIDTLPARLEDLARACQALDWSAMAALAHKLKGSAGLYGYSELASCVEGLERLAKLKAGDPTQSLEGIKHTVEKIVAGRTITAQRGQAPAAGGHVTPST